jgi:hypothetical protein
MNKAKIKQLAQEQAKTSREPATPDPKDDLQERLYVALVGSADFIRTQFGPIEICRIAFKRSQIAADVWRKEMAKIEGEA